ncbi:MAG: hypothetical protein V1850_02025 [Candidatus Bathyarchaeota archaeon]
MEVLTGFLLILTDGFVEVVSLVIKSGLLEEVGDAELPRLLTPDVAHQGGVIHRPAVCELVWCMSLSLFGSGFSPSLRSLLASSSIF